MQRIIWTLWWQGEENAPLLVKKCIESMRKHSNGASVIVLDQEKLSDYICLPERIKKLFGEGKISITHLSDIIRFRLLYQHGGLWLDSTVYVTEDIPQTLFLRDFYTIRNGVGNDDKNIAKRRWTAFLIGGTAGNIVFENMNRLFDKYWEINDELVCYLLIDFAMNEVYESVPKCREIIDSVPDYAGDVFTMMKKIKTEDDIEKITVNGIFHKLSYKDINKKQISRIKSLCRHIKELFCVRKWRKWGFKIAWFTFLKSCTRNSNSRLGLWIAQRYNEILGGGIGRLLGE